MSGTLVAGTTAVMRQVRAADDAAPISEFVCGLSSTSRYLRFFASVAPPSSGLLRALCGDTGADVLLVTDAAGAVVAHGMAADTRTSGGELASNIGLVVTDRWQGQGLGGLLLSTLVGRAAERGVGSLVLDVLPYNDRMLGIINRRWPDAPRERTADAIIVRPAITPSQATGNWQVPAIVRLSAQSGIRRSGETHASGQSAAEPARPGHRAQPCLRLGRSGDQRSSGTQARRRGIPRGHTHW